MLSLKEKRIEIPLASGLSLEGVLHMPEARPSAAVLICHGMLSYKDSPKHIGLARKLAGLGLAALRFDFQGRGASPGDLLELSFTRQVDEARAALEVLASASGAKRFGLAGSSMGGAVAVLLTAAGAQAVHALVTFAAVGRPGALGPRMMDPGGMRAWRERGWMEMEGERVGYAWFEDAQQSDVIAAAAKVQVPWLILHGEADEVVPVDEGQALHTACPDHSHLQVLAGADHRFSKPSDLAILTERCADFFSETLSP